MGSTGDGGVWVCGGEAFGFNAFGRGFVGLGFRAFRALRTLGVLGLWV